MFNYESSPSKVTFRLSHFAKSKILQAWAIRCLQPRLALSHDAMNWLSHLPMAGEDHVGKNTKTKISHVFLNRKSVRDSQQLLKGQSLVVMQDAFFGGKGVPGG